jgi:glutathione S-transferase
MRPRAERASGATGLWTGILGGPVAQPILYQWVASPGCALVRRLLRQHGVAFEAVTLPPGDASLVRAKFGLTQVPVLVHGTFRSGDVAEIAAHLSGEYGPAPAPGAARPAQPRRGRA